MADSFQTPSIPGRSPIDADVIQQVKHREAVFGNTTELDTEAIDPNQRLALVHSNTAYYRITSGVRLSNPEGADQALASDKMQLTGGILSATGKRREGFDFEKKFDESESLYSMDDTKYGITPAPHIDSISVGQFGNTSIPGAILQAEFTIKCYTKYQFDSIERLYSRPGFELLLEWGHGLKINKNGDYDTKTHLISDDILNEKSTSSSDVSNKIIEAGVELREESGYNYDFLLGRIVNYSWKYDSTSYSIEVRMIGRGLANFLAAGMKPGGGVLTEEEKAAKKDESERFKLSAGGFMDILESVNKGSSKNKTLKEGKKPVLIELKRSNFDRYIKAATALGILEENAGTMDMYQINFRGDSKPFNYIRYKHLLGLINIFFVDRVGGEKLGKGDYSFRLESGKSLYNTYDDHFSYDPSICLIPGVSDDTGKIDTSIATNASTDKPNQGDILEVLVNVEFIKGLYENTVLKEKAKKLGAATIGSFITQINREIGRALGYITDLQVTYDKDIDVDLGRSQVVDVSIAANIEQDPNDIQLIRPKGLESFITSFSINSELNPNLINLITAGTIANGGDAKKNTSLGLAAFNSGLNHKWKAPLKRAVTEDDVETEDDAAPVNPFDTLETAYKVGFYPDATISTVGSQMQTQIQGEYSKAIEGEGSSGMRGPIGGKLSMTLLGITGLKALQYFTIPNDFLPSSWYVGDVTIGFRVGNVSHTINNQWETTIEAQAIVLKGKYKKQS